MGNSSDKAMASSLPVTLLLTIQAENSRVLRLACSCAEQKKRPSDEKGSEKL
jgi:hypothetical protein